MPVTHKCRHQLYLGQDISAKLEALAAKPGASKSAILADAIHAWLNRRGAQELDDRFALRLNRIGAQLGRLERDQQVMLESLALFVRYQLTINAPLPEADAAMRAVGRDRFQSFIDQVGRQIAGGSRTLGRDFAGVERDRRDGRGERTNASDVNRDQGNRHDDRGEAGSVNHDSRQKHDDRTDSTGLNRDLRNGDDHRADASGVHRDRRNGHGDRSAEEASS